MNGIRTRITAMPGRRVPCLSLSSLSGPTGIRTRSFAVQTRRIPVLILSGRTLAFRAARHPGGILPAAQTILIGGLQ
jgi:hypothetical protein